MKKIRTAKIKYIVEFKNEDDAEKAFGLVLKKKLDIIINNNYEVKNTSLISPFKFSK